MLVTPELWDGANTWKRQLQAPSSAGQAASAGAAYAMLALWTSAGNACPVIAASVNTDANNGVNMLSTEQVFFNGATRDRMRHANVFKVVALTAATAETTLWTPTSGKKFRVMGFLLTAGAATTLTFKDNTAGTTVLAARGTTDMPIWFSPSASNGYLSAAANNVLTVTRSVSATLDGILFGTEE